MDPREKAFERKNVFLIYEEVYKYQIFCPNTGPKRESDSTVDQPPECFKMKETDWGVLKTFFAPFLPSVKRG